MSFPNKTKQQRLSEVLKVLIQIRNMGLPMDHNGIVELQKILSTWVNDGIYKKGKIKLTKYDF